jgi:hypothetical protein
LAGPPFCESRGGAFWLWFACMCVGDKVLKNESCLRASTHEFSNSMLTRVPALEKPHLCGFIAPVLEHVGSDRPEIVTLTSTHPQTVGDAYGDAMRGGGPGAERGVRAGMCGPEEQ